MTHYNFIKAKYGEKATLLLTDTDSLCYVIKTEDAYKDLIEHRDMFDNSDYPETSKFFFNDNKKVIGKFKDEAAGNPITEVVALKPKMYAYETEMVRKKICGKMYLLVNNITKNNKKAKGVKKYVVKKSIKQSHFKDCLFNNQIMYHKMRTIRSDHHVISSYEINKISLSCYDDKRYILDDGISSLAYGHFAIDKKMIDNI